MGFLCQSSSPQSSTVVQQLPDYILDPLKKNLQKAEDVTDAPYQAYQGQRIEGFNQDQLDAMQDIKNLQGKNQSNLDAAMSGIMGLQTYNPQQVQAQQFDSATAAQYMNPYTDNVLDRARQRIFDAEDVAAQKRAANQVAAGAFGDNSRRFIENSEAQSNLQDRLADMEAKQLAAAYESGAKMFDADANRELTADKLNQASGLTANQQNVNATLQGAAGIGNLAAKDQALALQQNQALQGIGAMQQQMGQSGLDLAYQDFLAQKNYPMEQVNYMANILQGAPMPMTQTTYGPPGPSPLQSIAGLGLAGLGIYGQGGGFGAGGFSMANLFS